MPAATLARSVLLEARRGGVPWLAAGALAIGLAAAAFLSQVALTETAALQLAVLAAVLRACAVFLVAAQVAAGTLREIQDKGLELMLALPLSRSTHYLGRLAGFVACGTALAAVFSAALLFWAPPLQVALWGLSLALEAALIAAAALFFAMTLPNVVAAIAATAGLYLLARAMPAIQALADNAARRRRRGRAGSRAARSTPSPSCCLAWTPRRGPSGWSTTRRRSPSTARRWPRSRSTSSC